MECAQVLINAQTVNVDSDAKPGWARGDFPGLSLGVSVLQSRIAA